MEINKDQEYVSPEKLMKMAKEHISDKVLMNAFKEKYFKEFMRIFVFMHWSAVTTKVDSSFGHSLTSRNEKKELIESAIQVTITPRKLTPQ